MRIAHIGLGSYYTDGMTYQDNLLSEQNVRDGHQVLYISNAAKYVDGNILETGYEDTILSCGIRLVRLPYKHIFTTFITNKVRKVFGLYALLNEFSPDVILSHSLSYWSLLDVIRYKKIHPEVKLYADTHAASYNSGTNWLSLYILHRIFYRYLIKIALPYLDRYFYVAEATRQFSTQNYGVPDSLMEFYPLGGIPLSEEIYEKKRSQRRLELELQEKDLLFIHSGKLDILKRTDTLLRAFAAVPELNARLVVIGSIPDDRKALLSSLMESDSRVTYLGWKTGEELQEYLCACDLYCQPGGPSATLQNAICCGCPILSYPHEDYTKDFDYGNFLWCKSEADMIEVFRQIQKNPTMLVTLQENSWLCARELLDYRKLAARLYQ